MSFIENYPISFLDDGDMQTGCNPNLSGDEGLDNDEEDDAGWRMLRLERETWLKEHVKIYNIFLGEIIFSLYARLPRNLLRVAPKTVSF